MKMIRHIGREGVAHLRVTAFDDGARAEIVESWEPGVPHRDKWVIIVSTLAGCPVRCLFCDAGGSYTRPFTADEMLQQIQCVVAARYPDLHVPVGHFKIQFARVGEPLMNPHLVPLVEMLPTALDAPGLMPCVSTIAPRGSIPRLETLAEVKDRLYPGGRFQLQFSIHTTDEEGRRDLIPWPTLSFREIARFGARRWRRRDRKITLNFALIEEASFQPEVIADHFDPDLFLVKITPVNPTARGVSRGVRSLYPDPPPLLLEKVSKLRSSGYDVLESIGNPEENEVLTNCGQYLGDAKESSSRTVRVRRSGT